MGDNMRGKGLFRKAMVFAALIALCIAVFSWLNVRGNEIEGVSQISSECLVTITYENEAGQEYQLQAEQVDRLKDLLLTSTFTRTFSSFVTYPVDTERYTIRIDWKDYQHVLIIHCIGNKYISIADHFGGRHLKIKNPEWESTIKRIISHSEPVR